MFFEPAPTTPLLSDEPGTPLRIGAGSFGSVHVFHGGPFAFKLVHAANHATNIENEYNALCEIYDDRNSDSFFFLPKPRAFHNPATSTLLFAPTTPCARRRRNVPAMPDSFTNPFTPFGNHAAYAMDRVHVLPFRLAEHIRAEFYPAFARDLRLSTLCRLYFGKLIEVNARPSRFFSSANFPLGAAQYCRLASAIPLAPPPEDVASGMGEMLGCIHWRSGYDARDIEFVMGGDGFRDFTFYVIDFNQMRRWNKSQTDVGPLVEAHYQNDPYYPRARISDSLYQAFKTGYLAACGAFTAGGQAFLDALEREQALRDGL